MLRFVVALAPEARPLISHFRLERDAGADAFALFRRDDVALAVSGIGKVASASATAYLHLAAGGRRHAAWLNVGIAGHGSREVGEAILAHEVRDRASGQCWFPPHVFATAVPTDSLNTVETVERSFPADGAYDMEASGFYPTACRFSSAEIVQCVKVVSDGPRSGIDRLTMIAVESLVESRMESILEVARQVDGLAGELRRLEAEPPEIPELLERWHFTVTESRQLRRLVGRWRTLTAGSPLPEEELSRLARGSDVIRRLSALLEALPVELGI